MVQCSLRLRRQGSGSTLNPTPVSGLQASEQLYVQGVGAWTSGQDLESLQACGLDLIHGFGLSA